MSALAPALSPHGVLSLKPSNEAMVWEPARRTRVVRAFERGAGHGLLCLGVMESLGWRNDRAVLFRSGRPDLAIRVEVTA
jgi:hypothetical protein